MVAGTVCAHLGGCAGRTQARAQEARAQKDNGRHEESRGERRETDVAWITVSGEDAPELIAASPVSRSEVELAKITAIGAPILVILALPLAGLALLSPFVALLVALFAAAAGVSTALLNLWHPMPGNRRGMLRRHSQSKLMALLEHLLALLWAVAIFLAVIGSVWVLLPIALILLLLACCRPA